MAKKNLFNIFLVGSLFLSPLLVAQEKEAYIKYDERYINSLGVDNDIDQNLTLDTFKNRFYFLNQNTPLSIDYNDITYGFVKKYLSYSWYGKLIGLSAYYFPLFEKKLVQYGLPPELKYLAVVESALNPRCISQVGASGLWQFMSVTGTQYGLKKSLDVNVFFDPVANTDCAVRFLRDLYKELGDWNLAISAYNCGAGNVRKAIRKAGTKSYWKVRPFLPKETQAYLPSFVAVNYMFNFYKKHNIKPSYFKYSFLDMKMLKIGRETSFRELGQVYSYSMLKFANPQFINEKIPPNSVVYVRK